MGCAVVAGIVDFCRVCTVELDADRIELGYVYCGKRCRGIWRRLAHAQELGDVHKYQAAVMAMMARRAEVRGSVAPGR